MILKMNASNFEIKKKFKPGVFLVSFHAEKVAAVVLWGKKRVTLFAAFAKILALFFSNMTITIIIVIIIRIALLLVRHN